MKNKILPMAFLLFLSGCATAYKINSVALGMSKSDVIRVMGRPSSTSAAAGREFMNYALYETKDDKFLGNATPYSIQMADGKVVSYGRYGDFGTTRDPKQIIEIITGGVK